MLTEPSTVKEEPRKRGPKPTKFRKAPQAPKRFKSAFIFFSIAKHPEIREQIKIDNNSNNGVPNVAKLVSEAWRNLSKEERAVWEKKAEDDKRRYEMERAMYTGPWKVPAPKRAKKDPGAPKRPMSAFLAYSKKMRSSAKADNPHLSNTEVSKLLATLWKDAPPEVRAEFIETEAKEREEYKVVMADWRVKNEAKLLAQRKQREELALNAIANGATPYDHGFHPPSGASQDPNGMRNVQGNGPYGYPQAQQHQMRYGQNPPYPPQGELGPAGFYYGGNEANSNGWNHQQNIPYESEGPAYYGSQGPQADNHSNYNHHNYDHQQMAQHDAHQPPLQAQTPYSMNSTTDHNFDHQQVAHQDTQHQQQPPPPQYSVQPQYNVNRTHDQNYDQKPIVQPDAQQQQHAQYSVNNTSTTYGQERLSHEAPQAQNPQYHNNINASQGYTTSDESWRFENSNYDPNEQSQHRATTDYQNENYYQI